MELKMSWRESIKEESSIPNRDTISQLKSI
jgi:hypothetical protein